MPKLSGPKEAWDDMSLVIPSYNTKPQHLLECIYSIYANTVWPGLCLIVNDFSDDQGTLQMYEYILNNYSDMNIKLIKSEEHTIGGGHPMNVGYRYIKDKYSLIRYMGSDDLLDDCMIYMHRHIIENWEVQFTEKLSQNPEYKQYMDNTKGMGGVQTYHIMMLEKLNKFVRTETASHPVMFVDKLSEFEYEPGKIWQENKARDVDGPVLARFYKKYFCATTTNYYGEVYRIHGDNQMSHNADGEWYGPIEDGEENDRKLNLYAKRKSFNQKQDNKVNRIIQKYKDGKLSKSKILRYTKEGIICSDHL